MARQRLCLYKVNVSKTKHFSNRNYFITEHLYQCMVYDPLNQNRFFDNKYYSLFPRGGFHYVKSYSGKIIIYSAVTVYEFSVNYTLQGINMKRRKIKMAQ